LINPGQLTREQALKDSTSQRLQQEMP